MLDWHFVPLKILESVSLLFKYFVPFVKYLITSEMCPVGSKPAMLMSNRMEITYFILHKNTNTPYNTSSIKKFYYILRGLFFFFFFFLNTICV